MTDLTPQSAEWHAARAKGIGSSDISAILGLSRYQTPWQLYLRKTGQLPPDPDNQYTEWGRRLEPVVLDAWEEQTGLVARRSNRMVTHRRVVWARCEVDAWAQEPADPMDTLGSIDAKTASTWARDWSTDDVPAGYAAQVQWQMEVANVDRAWIAALIGGNDFRVYELYRDRSLGEHLLERASEFWERVQTGNPPDPDGEQSTTEVLNRIYASVDADIVHVGRSAVDYAADYWRAHGVVKSAEEAKNEAGNRLRALMKTSDTAVHDGQTVATWKLQERGGIVDYKRLLADHPELAKKYARTVEFRVLRPTKTKE